MTPPEVFAAAAGAGVGVGIGLPALVWYVYLRGKLAGRSENPARRSGP